MRKKLEQKKQPEAKRKKRVEREDLERGKRRAVGEKGEGVTLVFGTLTFVLTFKLSETVGKIYLSNSCERGGV